MPSGKRVPGRCLSRVHASSASLARLSLGGLALLTLGLGGASVADAGTAGAQPTTSSTGIPSDNYWLADAQGAVWNFGDAAPSVRRRACPSTTRSSPSPRPRTRRGTGSWPPTAACSPTATPSFYGSTGAIAPQPAHRRHGPDPRRQGLLAGRLRRRHLLLRRRRLLRLDRRHRAQQAHRRHGRHPRRQGLLVGGVRRRHLQLRRRRLLRLDRGHPPEPADRRHGGDADGKGYWMVAADGGIFNFGDAAFDGSAAGGPASTRPRGSSRPLGPRLLGRGAERHRLPFGDATARRPTGRCCFPGHPGDRAVLFAFAQLGKPYIWGGNGPVGYDCSGLALASGRADGVGFARVSDDQYHTAGQPVALNALSPATSCSGATSQTDWTGCTTPPSTSAVTRSSKRPAITSS